MAKWQFTNSEPRRYPSLGFTATDGDVLESDAAPDALWASADAGTEATLPPTEVSGYTEPAAGTIPVYNADTNQAEYQTPEAVAASMDAGIAALLDDADSDLRASADARYAAASILGGSTCAILGDSLANNGEGIGYWIAALSKQAFAFPSSDYVRSYPGETSTQIVARITEITSMAVKPRFCIVSAGSNDAAGSVTGAAFQVNIVTLIEAMRAASIQPVLMTIPPRTGVFGLITEYNLRLRRLATVYGLPIIDAYAVLANPATEQYQAAYNSGDGIHPSAAGCKAVAVAAITALADVMSRPADLSVLASGVNLYPGAAFAADANADGLANGNSATPAAGFAYSRIADPSGFYWQRMTLTGTAAARTITGPNMLVGSGVTTLAASASAGATTLSLTAPVSTGGIYKITNSGGWYEYVKVTAVTGSGPYSATLDASTPLKAAHGAGASIAPAFAIGDKLALAARFRDGQDSAKFIVQFTFYNAALAVIGNRIISSPNSTNGMTQSVADAIGYTEFTIPATTDRIQFSITGGTTDGTYDVALPFVANLTALGLA